MRTKKSIPELLSAERRVVPLHTGGDRRVCLAYPNSYWVAMSSLGYQVVYRVLCTEPRLGVERAFVDEGLEAPRTMESGAPLSAVEIVFVSVSFEADYQRVLRLVEAAGRDFRNLKAGGRHGPLVVGGGVALTVNPEPLAPFFDAIVLGEAEETLPEMVRIYLEGRDRGAPAQELLENWGAVKGVYIPEAAAPEYDERGGLLPLPSSFRRPVRRYVQELDRQPTHTVIDTPNTEFGRAFVVETGRGCEMGCRFCISGYVYRPIRRRSAASLQRTIAESCLSGGQVGIQGAAVSRHPALTQVIEQVLAAQGRFSLSSLMTPCLTPELADQLRRGKNRSLALAPEAGSEALRFRVGKRVRDEEVLRAAAVLSDIGLKTLKLYFMIGLPSETVEDVREIARLVLEVRKRLNPAGIERTKLVLSVSPFVPKPWTPFQRHPFTATALLKERLAALRSGLARAAGIEVQGESPREAWFQALMSRGDRRLAKLLIFMHQHGKDWRWLIRQGSAQVVAEAPPPDQYVYRHFSAGQVLPWEIVDLGIKRSLLEREYNSCINEPGLDSGAFAAPAGQSQRSLL